jgi:hypothetical protein
MRTFIFCAKCYSRQKVAANGLTTCQCGEGCAKYEINGLATVVYGLISLYYKTRDGLLFATAEAGYAHEGEQFQEWLKTEPRYVDNPIRDGIE